MHLVEAAEQRADLFLAAPDIEELELDPVIVAHKSAGVRVLDTLLVGADPDRAKRKRLDSELSIQL